MIFYDDYNGPDPRLEIIRANAKRERKELFLLWMFSGGAILLYILIQNVLVLAMQLTGFSALYAKSTLVQVGADSLLSIVSFLVPFTLVSKPMRRISGVENPLPLGAPQQTGMFLLAIPAGVGACVLANRVTAYLLYYLTAVFGLQFSAPDLPVPGGVLGVAASFCRIVLIAALCEELCFRGFIMQNLRRYGDGFAITMAALVFGLMHGNLIQAPFALIVGLALGYFSVKTGTLWTGIIIHAINNTISLLASYVPDGDAAFSIVYAVGSTVLLWGGVACAILFIRRQKRLGPSLRYPGWNSFGARMGAFFSSPTMIISVILILYFTAQFVEVRR